MDPALLACFASRHSRPEARIRFEIGPKLPLVVRMNSQAFLADAVVELCKATMTA